MNVAGEVLLQCPLPHSLTKKTSITIINHSLHHFLPLYFLTRTLVELQITNEMQKANVEIHESIP